MFIPNNPTHKRTKLLRVKLTKDEESVLEKMADSYNINVSNFVREKVFGRMADYARNEIQNAVNSVRETVRRGYSTARERVRQLYDNMGEYVPMELDYAVAPVYK